jgi:hypothetical protein
MTELKMALASMKEYLKKRQSPCLYYIPDVAEAWVYNADNLIKHYAPIAQGFSWLTAMQRYRAEVAKKGHVEGESARVLISVTENFVKEVEEYIAQKTCPAKEDKSSITVAVSTVFSSVSEKTVAGLIVENGQLREELEERKRGFKSVQESLRRTIDQRDQAWSGASRLNAYLHRKEQEIAALKEEGNKLREDLKILTASAVNRTQVLAALDSARTWQRVAESRFDSINELKRVNAKLELDTNNRAEKIEKLEAEIKSLRSLKLAQNSYVLAYGDLQEGYKLVGPFVSREVAEYYCLRDDPNTEILEVFVPDED